MNHFKDYLAEMDAFRNPMSDVEKYITGLANRLRLLRPEEIEQLKPKLMILAELLGNLVK